MSEQLKEKAKTTWTISKEVTSHLGSDFYMEKKWVLLSDAKVPKRGKNMTDQRTLKRIINEQREEIQQLKKENNEATKLLIDGQKLIDAWKNLNDDYHQECEKLSKQVEAAKTILKPPFPFTFNSMAEQLQQLREVFGETTK